MTPEPSLARVVTRIAAAATIADLVVVAASGVYLTFNYRPTIPGSRISCGPVRCPRDVPLLIRHVHRWSSYSLIALTLVALVGMVLLHASERPKNPATPTAWLPAGLASASAAVAALTGWFLPWDQLALWVVTRDQYGWLIGYRFLWHERSVRFLLVGGEEESPHVARWIFVAHVGLGVLAAACAFIVVWQSFRRARGNRLVDPASAGATSQPDDAVL